MSSRMTAADKLAMMLHARLPRAERAETPWGTVEAQALAAADAVECGRYHEPLPTDDGASLRERVRSLVDIATHVYAWTYRRAIKRLDLTIRVGGSWERHGVRWSYPRHALGEHHALCLFCGENLHTFGRGTHKVGEALLRRWERHALACALRGLYLCGDRRWSRPAGADGS